eukprot:9471555-Pyramimonas_sp.AAC.1
MKRALALRGLQEVSRAPNRTPFGLDPPGVPPPEPSWGLLGALLRPLVPPRASGRVGRGLHGDVCTELEGAARPHASQEAPIGDQ